MSMTIQLICLLLELQLISLLIMKLILQVDLVDSQCILQITSPRGDVICQFEKRYSVADATKS